MKDFIEFLEQNPNMNDELKSEFSKMCFGGFIMLDEVGCERDGDYLGDLDEIVNKLWSFSMDKIINVANSFDEEE